jgi:solute carrier family 25 carnitine/acylcarnitine transporter 20/29
MSAAPAPAPWQRFLAGTASGIALVLVGHPLDTVRVRMQLGERSFLAAVASVSRAGGVRGFYAGMGPPLLFTGAINTVLWGLTFSCIDAMAAAGVGGGPTQRTVLASVPCGVAIALLVTPVEGIKSRMQARARAGGGGAGALATARAALAADGVARGLWRGGAACALARGSNYAYFGASAAVLEALGPAPAGGWLRTRNALLSGAGAGVAYWCCALPFDTLKARMMACADGLRPRPTLRATAAAVYAEGGLRAFWRGLAPALLRAVPTNAATFLTFDVAMGLLNPPLESNN